MSENFIIASLTAKKGGIVGVCALPGRNGTLEQDLEILFGWQPDVVVSMTEMSEMEQAGCENLAQALEAKGIIWLHLPIRDYGGPDGTSEDAWPDMSAGIHRLLDQGGRVLLHCRGGHGRSGMIAMRLLTGRGELPEHALARLRAVRPGAVETAEQEAWASLPAV